MRTREYNYKGKAYPSLKALAKAFGLNISTLASRLYTSKMSLDEALSRPAPVQCKLVYKNKKYTTYSSLARKFGLSGDRLKHRLDRGMSLEEALKTPLKGTGKAKPIAYQGVEFKSIVELASHYNISYRLLQKRLARNMPLDRALSPELLHIGSSKETTYKGVVYPSIKALALAYNLKPSVLVERINRGWDLETAVTEPVRTAIEFRGNVYKTYVELADAFNLPVNIIYERIGLGWDLEKVVTKPLVTRHRK